MFDQFRSYLVIEKLYIKSVGQICFKRHVNQRHEVNHCQRESLQLLSHLSQADFLQITTCKLINGSKGRFSTEMTYLD